MNLYELNKARFALLAELQDLEGELSPELEARLTALDAALDDKLEACCAVLKNMHGMAELHDAEIKRLKERRDAIEARAERLREWVGSFLGAEGWERGLHRLSWRNSEAVECELEKLPDQYRVAKVVESADKKLLLTALKTGAQIPGAQLVKRKHLQLK
jgi:hypothetical protein